LTNWTTALNVCSVLPVIPQDLVCSYVIGQFENMNPDMTTNRMSLDVSVSPKKKEDTIKYNFK